MKLNFAIILVFWCMTSCRQSIEYDNIQNKDGIYIDKTTNRILNGRYRSKTLNSFSKETIIKKEFKDGIQVGEWEEWHGDELIHIGKYIQEDKLSKQIKNIAGSKRVNLNLWKEGNYEMLSIELVQPTYADTSRFEKIAEITKKALIDKFSFTTLIIDSISNSKVDRRIFEKQIQ